MALEVKRELVLWGTFDFIVTRSLQFVSVGKCGTTLLPESKEIVLARESRDTDDLIVSVGVLT